MTRPDLSGSDVLDLQRQAFLLHQLAAAPNGTRTRADADKRIPKPLQEELTLTPATADTWRGTLKDRGLVREVGGKGVAHAITDAGREWLREHDVFIPLAPARGKVGPPPDAAVANARTVWVMLQLLDAPAEGASATTLNKRRAPARLGLNSATTRQVRGELVVRRLVAVSRTPRSERFTLTPAGVTHMAGLSFDGLGTLKITAPALTRLLQAARGTSAPPPLAPPAPAPVPPGQLEQVVMDTFHELLGQRYAALQMVPIHEIRAAVAARCGPDAASHSVLDGLLLDLRRARKVGLVSISDRSRVTPEQLQDSVSAVGETFFYVENRRG
ncbi:hypothetical protein J0H58_03445 [bacterium]|nr:hypothetical protein [bacterium]